MISINTYLVPFRLRIGDKPINLEVELINRGNETELTSLEIVLGQGLTLEKGKPLYRKQEFLGEIKPGEKRKFTYPIECSSFAKPGNQPMLVKANEHFHEYKYIKREYSKRIEVKIE